MDSFQKNIPIEWISEAVKQTGRAAVRKRRFPSEQAVWLVLGIGLMRDRSISDICDKLELAFPDSKGKLQPLVTSSVMKAGNVLVLSHSGTYSILPQASRKKRISLPQLVDLRF